MVSNSSLSSLATAVASAATCVFVWKLIRQRKNFPPGPHRYPIIGNILNMPDLADSAALGELGKKHGTNILHFEGLGNNVIVLNSYEDAQELLDKRSGVYSGRPQTVMFHELSGWGFQFAVWPYGEKWRAARKLFTQHFSSPEIHQPRETLYIHRLLRQLLQDPDAYFSQVKSLPAAIVIDMTYGIRIEPVNDPYMSVLEQAADFSGGTLSAQWMVDLIPALKYLPTWFPGATFHTKAALARAYADEFIETPYAGTKRNITTGNSERCFVTDCLDHDVESSSNKAQHEDLVKFVAAQVFLAGSDTTAASISSIFFAMVTHPDVQRKAQEELDTVLQGRLPEHRDLESLPYLNAVILEVLRWKPVTPFGVPHVVEGDDVYQGYHIPAGATIVANEGAMLFDETTYPDPHVFKPERFLKNGALDPSVRSPLDILFGFGRRVCPGRHIALSMVTLTAASVLCVFNLRKRTNESGEVIEPNGEYHRSIVNKLYEFPCIIEPRSPHAVSLVQSLNED